MTAIKTNLQPLVLPQHTNQHKQDQKNNPNTGDNNDKPKTAGNHATDVGVGGHKMSAEERELASQKAREQAVDTSPFNTRLMRHHGYGKELPADVLKKLKQQLIMGFARLDADDAGYIAKPKRTASMPIVQELAKQAVRQRASDFIKSTVQNQEKPPTPTKH